VRLQRLDRFQQGRSAAGFPLAVVYKLMEDRGPYLAALITYYGFVSLFPLLLLFVSAAGFFLDGAPGVRQRLIQSASENFPVVGDQLVHNISQFHGSGPALAAGIVGVLYGALGAMQAAQTAFNQLYGVPRNEQPNPIKSRIRSLGLVGLLGLAVVVSTGIASFVSLADYVPVLTRFELRLAGYAISLAIDVALFTAAFQLLTARDLKIRNVITGGLLAGTIELLLQTFGTKYVAHQASRGDALYGAFGIALAALAWIYLQALALVLAAEVNVVLHQRLWPRALLTPFTDAVHLTTADRKVYRMYAATQRFKGFETIRADFGGGYPDEGTASGDPSVEPSERQEAHTTPWHEDS
jgi:YihY family inner membrane protein